MCFIATVSNDTGHWTLTMSTTYLADFYPKTKVRPAQLDIHTVVGGRRVAHRVYDVANKADARALADAHGAVHNNF